MTRVLHFICGKLDRRDGAHRLANGRLMPALHFLEGYFRGHFPRRILVDPAMAGPGPGRHHHRWPRDWKSELRPWTDSEARKLKKSGPSAAQMQASRRGEPPSGEDASSSGFTVGPLPNGGFFLVQPGAPAIAPEWTRCCWRQRFRKSAQEGGCWPISRRRRGRRRPCRRAPAADSERVVLIERAPINSWPIVPCRTAPACRKRPIWRPALGVDRKEPMSRLQEGSGLARVKGLED